jgi:hypothetical protein
MNVDMVSLEKAIDSIYSGFVWNLSPEGYSYWRDTVKNLEQIPYAPIKRKPTMPSTLDTKICVDASQALIVAFTWAVSPQGRDYWKERYCKLISMSQPKKQENNTRKEQIKAYDRAMRGI